MMRRLLQFCLLALLPGCATLSSSMDSVGTTLSDITPNPSGWVGNPVDGFGSFASDTLLPFPNANRPMGDAPNILRAEGKQVTTQPLLPDDGHVWPGPLPPSKTLADLAKDTTGLEPDMSNTVGTHGSSTPPSAPTPMVPPLRITPAPLSQPAPKPQSRVFQTPAGPAISSIGSGGMETFTLPNGMMGTVVNNGNGTATLVRTDGVSTVVPMPR